MKTHCPAQRFPKSRWSQNALTRLDGLSQLSSVGGILIIWYNGNLPYCEICDVFGLIIDDGVPTTCGDNLEDDCWDVDQLVCP